MAKSKFLIYLLRRDLRVSDNPIFHHLATSSDHGFTHLLPIYVFPANQIEIAGFLKKGEESPYPQALSQVSRVWRCGANRARFIGESVWDVKETLEGLNSGLLLRVGSFRDVVQTTIEALKEQQHDVEAVWMTEEMSVEEKQQQDSVASVCNSADVAFKLWADEKYLIDDRDNDLENPEDLPDVFTSYRKMQEPLRERPRSALPRPERSSLPAFPSSSEVPPQCGPFEVVSTLDDLKSRLLAPLKNFIDDPPAFPEGAHSPHPFTGGENNALKRLEHIVGSGVTRSYKDTRNGLLGVDFSTKLSAYLALGSISARQVHNEMLIYEDGTDSKYESTEGYGKGENDGTKGVRFELLWRDYMRLCTKKFGQKLFRLEGFRQDPAYNDKWRTPNRNKMHKGQSQPPEQVAAILKRFYAGTTGMGFIDASQRELFHTGYTSNRARQNVASFLAKHLQIDWRYGAEWYEMLLVDYDVSSNWSNWQYVAGVGNDPRGDARIFNPVKQAFDYDKEGRYVRTWVPEVQDLEKLENVFQPSTTEEAELERCGLKSSILVTDPIVRIEFSIDKKPKAPRKPYAKKRGNRGGRGGRGGGGGGGGDGGRGRGGGGGSSSGHGRNTYSKGSSNGPLGDNGNATVPSEWSNGNYKSHNYSHHQYGNLGDPGGDYNDGQSPQPFHQQGIPIADNTYPSSDYGNNQWYFRPNIGNGYPNNNHGWQGQNGYNNQNSYGGYNGYFGQSRGFRGGRGGRGSRGGNGYGHGYQGVGANMYQPVSYPQHHGYSA